MLNEEQVKIRLWLMRELGVILLKFFFPLGGKLVQGEHNIFFKTMDVSFDLSCQVQKSKAMKK